MKFIQSYALVLLISILTAGMTLADTGYPYVGSITLESNEESSIFVLPDGSGPPLSQAMGFGGQIVDSSVQVTLVDSWYYPIPDFPGEDMWLGTDAPTSVVCGSYQDRGFVFEGTTDHNGEITFTGPLAGGGWSEGPIWVYVNGFRAMDENHNQHPPLPLRFNSADINADAVVDLLDVILFVEDYLGAYNYSSDFHWDGQLNLLDLNSMALGMGSNCE
jgi:hypothetical protein